MIIYKITNKITNKVYIGQTINSLEDRWHRHCTDAMNNVLNTHFARAIRLYGIDNFVCEIIDKADNQIDLTAKENYWIRYYNSVENGYNETDATYKSGGNTYKNKSLDEMKIIKQKISDSKKGEKNPNSTAVKCRNIKTNEEYHFKTQNEMKDFFNETNHQFCSRRCRNEINCLYKNEWLIAYEENDYPIDFSIKGPIRRGNEIVFTDLINQKTYRFHSYREAERQLKELGYDDRPNRSKMASIIAGKTKQPKNYIIELIK